MVIFKMEILINAPSEVVDEALWTPGNAECWTKDLERFELVKGKPREVGTVGRLHYVQGGKEHIMEDVLEYSEPGKRYRSRVSGPAISATVETILEPVNGKTKVRIIWDGKGKILTLKLLLPLLKRKLVRQSLDEFRTFKELVETRGSDFTFKDKIDVVKK
jgi:hypothetical protein